MGNGIAAALLLSAAALAGCGAEPAPAPPPPTPAGGAPAAPAAYPLDTCPVSGEKLGSMGDPVVVKHGDVEVRLCCRGCLKAFDADPAKYAAMVTAARK
ncbi:MAG: hypothetical protein L6R43_03260 [Planctomycetes bacterium]|nr:hypothetical protein [Planctomycetota bacterium]